VTRHPAPRDPAEATHSDPSLSGDAPAETSLHKIRARVPDVPGALTRLSEAVASVGANILSLSVHSSDSSSVVNEVYVVAHPSLTTSHLADVVAASTGYPVHAMLADPHDLADEPTRALELAAQARDHPDGLPEALRALVHADQVRVTSTLPEADEHELVVRSPGGTGWLVMTRRWTPFTRTEQARAEALLRATLAATVAESWRAL
jgi:hypothetical protein